MQPKPPGNGNAPTRQGTDARESLPRRILGMALEGGEARVMTFLALMFIVFSSVFVFNAWQFGPNVLLERAEYRKFTGSASARIVESWLALEVDVSGIVDPSFWRASARASPCAVVEYDGDWGAPMRRAFCGNRLEFNDSYALQPLNTMAPDVPFAWARDQRGFVVPEIRVDPRALQWLSTHAVDTFMHRQWPAKTALDWLRLEEDRPIEAAVVGWSAKPAIMPVLYDPAHPDSALPAGIVHSRQEARVIWPVIVIFAVIGAPLWFAGVELLPLLAGVHPWGRHIFAAILMCTVPWWNDHFPEAVSHFNRQVGSMVADMFSDITVLDRVIASEPSDATLFAGERIAWRLEDSAYADTLGRYRLTPPASASLSADEALTRLATVVAAQTRELPDAERAAVFARLERDKRNDLRAAGIAFVPAAREALMTADTDSRVRAAARRFLGEWETSPTEEVDKYTPGYREWWSIENSLVDVPVPEIANMAAARHAAAKTGNEGR